MTNKLFDVRQWSDRAAEARSQAETSQDPAQKRALLDMARNYDQLADQALAMSRSSGVFEPDTTPIDDGTPREKVMPSILFVDDEDAFRYATTKVLENAGFAVSAEDDYIGALKVLESSKPIDLLLLDIMMPNRINGFALARMARMRRLGMKVVFLTGYDLAINEAIGPVLRKPVGDDVLVSEIRRALAS